VKGTDDAVAPGLDTDKQGTASHAKFSFFRCENRLISHGNIMVWLMIGWMMNVKECGRTARCRVQTSSMYARMPFVLMMS
jgi:hypothetical protein